MPELPEVDRARAELQRHVVGRVIADADDSDSFVCRPWLPGQISETLAGHKVVDVRRTGKQLMIDTDGPVLGIHLGMSGGFRFDTVRDQPFTRFSLGFADGGNLVFRDPRRLGRVTLDPVESRLGPDAMEVPLDRFRDLVGRSRSPVKARIMDQQVVAGIGNLLADEALWRARIDPRRRGVDLDAEELARLRRAVRAAIREAVRLGGSGRTRFGAARGIGICPRDGAELRQAKVGGRTTRWCPVEQR
jgi:formamidopyrimidine-DNA glycosylase